MSSRRLRWLVLCFTFVWFGMLVPVHQRGAITLPGTAALPAGDGAGHCSRMSDPSSACHKRLQDQQKDRSDGKRTPARTGGCAVCHFIVALHAPPPVVSVEARLGLLESLPAEERSVAPLRHAALPFHGLDPPLA
jgi:hypothetical protein